MPDIEKVIKGIECCICQGETRGPCSPECPYEVIEMDDCWIALNEDVLELLKKHKEHEELLTKLGYHWTGNGETLALCKKSKAGEQE